MLTLAKSGDANAPQKSAGTRRVASLPQLQIAHCPTLPHQMIFLVAMVFIVPVVLGLLIAAGIYKYGRTAAYDANMKPLIAKDMHWVYLAVVVLGRCVAFVNMYPMTYKSKV